MGNFVEIFFGIFVEGNLALEYQISQFPSAGDRRDAIGPEEDEI
jgi:hypothetical protein